jgi:hypothetical protein
MPYFVFRVSPDKSDLELLDSFAKFQDAKDLCRDRRRTESPDDPDRIRMAFAKSEYEAKRLLSEKREPSSPLEEWEA